MINSMVSVNRKDSTMIPKFLSGSLLFGLIVCLNPEVCFAQDPRFIVMLTSEGNGTVLGAGEYDQNASVNLVATPSLGFVFAGWSGDFNSSESNTSFLINADFNITALFGEDTSDSDNDGLSNYYELVVFDSNVSNPDTDGDGFTDFEENRTGLDPNVANGDYRALFDQSISEASTNGFNDGVAWITQNRATYDFNTSAELQYEYGYEQGFSDAVALVKENNNTLYYEWEINEFIAQATQDREDLVRSELGSGVAGLTSISQLRAERSPHAQNWYYQPGLGWLWTSQTVFPFVYFADDDQAGGPRWIYSTILDGLDDGSYFDFLTDGIIDSRYLSTP